MSDESRELTAEELTALKIAGALIDAGIPVFAAAPNPDKPGEYYLPPEWQKTVPSHTWLEKWRPGWALGAVGGHVADFLDFDPRNGGGESQRELELQGQTPRAFGMQRTPSGGTHLIISPTGERKATGFMPGVDLQSGAAEAINGSHGRGFVYIAPTVRPSKAPETLGQLRPYVWEREPELDYLKEFGRGADDTLDGLLARVHAARGIKARESTPVAAGMSQLFPGETRTPFDRAEAEAFCAPLLEALEQAKIGDIEDRCNDAAAILSHFVPAIWSPDYAFTVLKLSLAHTAYDPSHPASTWTVDKFLPVLDGRRPPMDNWKAARKVSPEEVAAAFGNTEAPVAPPSSETEVQDLIQAMLDKMLTPEQMASMPPPQPLIKGLLDLDSLSWIIGAPGSFKSFISLDMAAHVGTGLPWKDMEVTQGPVVYIAAEGTRGMGKRVRAWEKKYGHMGDVRFLPLPIKIKDVVAWQTLIAVCRRIRPVMVVVDTQARVTTGMEENSNSDMSVAVDAFDSIKSATGACVLIVHHTGRNGQDARGASAIDGAQDTELKLERQNPRSSMIVKLKEDKQKDMGESEAGITLKLVEELLSKEGEDRLTSLRVADRWEEVAGNAEPEIEVEQWRGREPGEWTKQYVTPNSKWQRRILQVLFDHAETVGLSETKIKETVIGRWKDKPDVETWNDAYPKVIDRDIREGEYMGDKLTFPVSGRRAMHTALREGIQGSGLS